MADFIKLQNCLKTIREKTDFVPKLALVLGSGLGDGSNISAEFTLDYSEIDGFPVSTVAGHAGRFIFGHIEGVPVVAMQGRVHYYEGYTMEDVVLPVRLMGLLGAKVLMLSNAAGGANFTFSQGDLMLIRDHISLFVPSPLLGKNVDELGPRFPDMSRVYDPELCGIIRLAAAENGIPLKEGTYIQLTGPQYETPAEVRMCRSLGADAIGMSTACEAIAAHHMGMRVCGISCITNLACGMTDTALSHDEVALTAKRVENSCKTLISRSIAKMTGLL